MMVFLSGVLMKRSAPEARPRVQLNFTGMAQTSPNHQQATSRYTAWTPSPVHQRWMLAFLCDGIAVFESKTAGDFEIFLAAASDFFQGVNPYEQLYHEWYHYYYDLLFLALIYPLTVLPLGLAKFAWILILEVAMVRSWMLMERWLPARDDAKGAFLERSAWVLASANLWLINFHLHQLTPILLWLMLEAAQETQRRWRGGMVGLGIALKVLPIAAIPMWFLRGNWVKLRNAGIAFVVALAVPFLWTESNRALQLLESRWVLLNPSNEEHVFDVDEESFHSVTTWVPTLTSENARGDNTKTWRRHIIDLPVPQVHVLTRMVQLLLLCAVLAFLTAPPWRQPASPAYEWAGLLAIIPLVFPHQQIYSFLFAFPAISWLIRNGWFVTDSSMTRLVKALSIAAMLLLNFHLYLGAYRGFYNHYKLVTVGALLLVWCLYQTKPTKALRH